MNSPVEEAINIIRSQISLKKISVIDMETASRLLESSVLSEDQLSALVSILGQTVSAPDYYELDPEFVLIKVYEVILAKLPIEVILDHYPIEFIIENILYGNQFTLLILKIVTLNHQKLELIENNLLYSILSEYLKNIDLRISITNQIHILLLALPKDVLEELNGEKFQNLFTEARNGNSVTISRLLDLIDVVVPHVKCDLVFSLEGDDVLLTLLIINFYERLVKKQDPDILHAIETPISQIFGLYDKREHDVEVDAFLVSDIVNFIASLSYSFPDYPIPCIKTLSVEVDSSIQLLSKINPRQIEQELLAKIAEYPLFNTKYFGVLLNLVSLEEAFRFLISKGSLTPALIKSLPLDLMFVFLRELTREEFGVRYLLTELPSVVTEYVLPHDVVNTEIYTTKLELLENLVLKNYDLLIWEDQLINTYKEMKNGKNIRHQVRVQVEEEAA